MATSTPSAPQHYTLRGTIADLKPTSEHHVNSGTYTIFKDRGLEIALQANVNEQGIRVEGKSPVHKHDEHDELVKILGDGNYGMHNMASLEQVGDILRIQAGKYHGGESNGAWISAKPTGFRHLRTIPEDGRIEYSGLVVTSGKNDGALVKGIERLVIIVDVTPEIVRIHGFNDPLTVELMSFEFLR